MPAHAEHLTTLLHTAFAARRELLDADLESALRLFNGFYEGYPDLVVELYARTLVVRDYAGSPADGPERHALWSAVATDFRAHCPWLRAVVLKRPRATGPAARQGKFLYGGTADRRIREHGVRYALELRMHRDTSFYLDTRNLRAWAGRRLANKTVLNTFAYTGSLGVAATAGGATRVVQIDRNRAFLTVAKASYALNGFPVRRADFQAADFWTQINHLKRNGERFDCVIVDPPLFSTTGKGTVDLVNQSHRVINKVRPLINDGGHLVTINNALFVSGAAYLRTLEGLCADGYLTVEELIPVPPDCTGFPHTVVRLPPADPAPFNHPTKIAVLRVRRDSRAV